MNSIKVLQIGIGPLGQKITNYILERKGLEIIGAVDIDLGKVGKDLGELCSIAPLGIIISGSLESAIKNNKPDAAILTTVSSMEKIIPQVEEIASFGIPVVSTCEELVYPWRAFPGLAEQLDKYVKRHNTAVVGTGVNPGYLMDSLPVHLTAVCQQVKTIKVSRVQNASYRRIPFQEKIGAGLSIREFEKKKEQGTFGHVGLTNSVEMIAAGMGWKLSQVKETMEAIIAKEKIVTRAMTIHKNHLTGILQIASGHVNNQERIILIFQAAVEQPNPHDTIEIEGEPPVVSTIKGGINGDIATCAIVINTLKQIIHASPGLKTMIDLPPVSYF